MKHMFCVRVEREKDLALPAMILYIIRDQPTAARGRVAHGPGDGETDSVHASAAAASPADSPDTLIADLLVKRVSSGSGWEHHHCMATDDALLVFTEPSAVSSLMTFAFSFTGSNRCVVALDDTRDNVLRISGGASVKQEALLQFADAGELLVPCSVVVPPPLASFPARVGAPHYDSLTQCSGGHCLEEPHRHCAAVN
jgi:hypothetical protein